MLVSKAATLNKISVINCPKNSSSKKEARIKLIFIPSKIISKLKRTNRKFGLRSNTIRADKMKKKERLNIEFI